MTSQYIDDDKRYAATSDYTRLNDYDHSMRTAPQISHLRYVLVPGSKKKFNISQAQEAQKVQEPQTKIVVDTDESNYTNYQK